MPPRRTKSADECWGPTATGHTWQEVLSALAQQVGFAAHRTMARQRIAQESPKKLD